MSTRDTDWFDGLPVGDLEDLKKTIELVRIIGGDKSDEERRRQFFYFGLRSFYDCMYEGMTTDVGHLFYRLSDHVPEDVRKEMFIYPSSREPEYRGSIYRKEKDGMEGYWYSLEDWRKEWAKNHPIIPQFTPKLLWSGE